MKKSLSACILSLLLFGWLCILPEARADVPPPPVNQLLGIYDTLLIDPTEDDCRACHGTSVSDRHHMKVETDGMECLDCHDSVYNEDCGCYEFPDEGDCMVCHIWDPEARPSVPHHVSDAATERHCSDCHGSIVQDYDDEHYIPTYDVSEVTPDAVCKTWEEDTCVSGGCEACHTEDSSASPMVYGYGDLHHGTAFDCDYCHQAHENLRDCETCHGPDSLHSIQVDSDNPDNLGTIVPGEEAYGWGHVGNSWDCYACHESFTGTSATPQTAAIIPHVAEVSWISGVSGKEATLNVKGDGFLNTSDSVVYEADVVVTRDEVPVTLEKISASDKEIQVRVPSTLEPGNYDLRAVKEDKVSNKIVISMVPEVKIESATLKWNVVTLVGSGFGGYLYDYEVGLGVSTEAWGWEVNCDVLSWTETEVVARCGWLCGTVTVDSIFGSASAQMERVLPVPEARAEDR